MTLLLSKTTVLIVHGKRQSRWWLGWMFFFFLPIDGRAGQNRTYKTTLYALKTLQLSQSCEHCLYSQLWEFSRKFFELGYPKNAKKQEKSALFAKYYLLILDKNKNERQIFVNGSTVRNFYCLETRIYRVYTTVK